jgi:diguanylate cyclase (GGDEF)-like protein
MTETASTPRDDQRSDASRSATADALRHSSRRALLCLYPPEQVADWFELHAAADPAMTAQKVLRLCGHEPGTSSLPVSRPFAPPAEPSKSQREVGDLAQAPPIARKDHDARRISGEPSEEVRTLLLEIVRQLGGRPREHLGVHLPRPVEDARRTLDRLERRGPLATDAERDPLTGVLNRRAYDRLAGRLRAGDALVLLDLDDLEAVNDTYGRRVGDQVLRSFGSVLRDQVRITEQPIRLGGDEFLVVLEEPGFDGCQRLLDRLRVAWREHRPLPVEFSAGTAVVTTDVEVALDTAARALYEQKHGRSE